MIDAATQGPPPVRREVAEGPTTFGEVRRTPADMVARAIAQFGAVDEHLPDFAAAARTADRVIEAIQEDAQLVLLSNRWRVGRNDPAPYVPGDVCARRAFAWSADVAGARDALDAFERDPRSETKALMAVGAVSSIAAAADVYDAAPFFLSAHVVDAVLRATPPQEEDFSAVRLPFERVLVLFEVDFGVRELVVGEGTVDGSSVMTTASAAFMEMSLPSVPALWQRGGGVGGVLLKAGPGGVGIADQVQWLVTINPDPSQPGPFALDCQRCFVEGSLRASMLASAVTSLAAVVAIGPWQEPSALEIDLGSRDGRRTLKTRRGRQAFERGSLSGVRTLVVKPPKSPTRPSGSGSGRASPATHVRGPRFQRYRVGPRDDWTYELKFLSPVMVNPGATPVGQRVYVLPDAVALARLPAEQPAGGEDREV